MVDDIELVTVGESLDSLATQSPNNQGCDRLPDITGEVERSVRWIREKDFAEKLDRYLGRTDERPVTNPRVRGLR